MYLEIDGWKCGITFSACHLIPKHDQCSHLHGHVYGVHLRIVGEPVDGMILDFGVAKAALRKLVSELDHRVLLPAHKAEKVGSSIEITQNDKHYVLPEEDVALVDVEDCTAEHLAGYMLAKVLPHIRRPNISEVQLGLDEGWGQGAWVTRKL